MKIVWTEEQFTKAKELKAKGLSFTKVGKELGMTKNAVIGKFHRQNKKEGHKVKKQTRGPSHNYYFKTIGSGICNLCQKKFNIESKFDRFCKPCKTTSMYIGSH
jgi:predicted transcriptional regulator